MSALHRHILSVSIVKDRRLSREQALQALESCKSNAPMAEQRRLAQSREGLISLGLLTPAPLLTRGAGFGK